MSIAERFSKLLTPKTVVTWMPESFYFRRPFGSQRVKWSETLLKSARKHFYDNFLLISNKLSCVSCLLVGSEILVPFCNMLTADHRYSCHNWEKFPQKGQPQLSWKPRTFFRSFIAFLKFTWNFEVFWRKRSPSEPKHFRSYWVRKMWLLEWPKGSISENLLEVNVLSGGKHCWSLNASTFMLTFH